MLDTSEQEGEMEEVAAWEGGKRLCPSLHRLPSFLLSVCRASPAEESFPGAWNAGTEVEGGRKEEPVGLTKVLEM